MSLEVFKWPSVESTRLAYYHDLNANHLGISVEQQRQSNHDQFRTDANTNNLVLSFDRDISTNIALLLNIGVRQADDNSRVQTTRLGVDWYQYNTVWSSELNYRKFALTAEGLNGNTRRRNASSTGLELAVLHFLTDNLAVGARAAKHNPNINRRTRAQLARPLLQVLLTPSTTDILFALIDYEFAIDANLSVSQWLFSGELGVVRTWFDAINSQHISLNIDRALGHRWHVDLTLVRQFTDGEDEGSGICIGTRFQW